MTAPPGHGDTYYAATTELPPPRRALSGRRTAAVVVIGGGLAGLSVALELCERGLDAVVLEADRIAHGASGRNGGFVTPGYAESLDAIVARVGLDAARALLALSREGVEIVRERVARLDPGARLGDGVMLVARRPRAAELAASRDRLEALFGWPLMIQSSKATRALLATTRYFEALVDPRAFHIQPLRYALALAAAIESRGGRIHEQSRALSLRRDGDAWVVATPAGEVRAGSVVLAMSALDRSLFPPLGRAILPVATYMIATAPLGGLAERAIATQAAIADGRRAGDYYRRVGSRILWGGRITTRTSEPRRLGHRLAADMAAVYPTLAGAPIAHAWSGLMGYARHRMPIVGRLGAGLHAATAFGGHGLNTTAAAGRVIAEAITAESDRWRMFEAFGPVHAGGLAGRAAVQASYWGKQLQDRFEERGAG